MAASWDKVTLGRTGMKVLPLGLGSSYGISAADVERACERGVGYLYWGSMRRPDFGRGIAAVARRRREDLVVVVQSYSRAASLMRPSLESALRKLGLDHADILLLGWWNQPPPARIVDAALQLREAGRCRAIMISSHQRRMFAGITGNGAYGAFMVRYNAAHTGAETEVFPHLPPDGPGIVAYTATRWGGLLDPRLVPPGEPTPRASDCYRFALTHPAVHVVLSGPRNGEELDEALAALDRGPMTADEIAWMKRVGQAVRAASMVRGAADAPVTVLERAVTQVRRWLRS